MSSTMLALTWLVTPVTRWLRRTNPILALSWVPLALPIARLLSLLMWRIHHAAIALLTSWLRPTTSRLVQIFSLLRPSLTLSTPRLLCMPSANSWRILVLIFQSLYLAHWLTSLAGLCQDRRERPSTTHFVMQSQCALVSTVVPMSLTLMLTTACLMALQRCRNSSGSQ